MAVKRSLCSVLIVSAVPSISTKLAEMIASPSTDIVYAENAAEARRFLISAPNIDIVIINTPLPDEFGRTLAIDMEENSGVEVMLLAKSEVYEQLASELEPYGIPVIPKPTNRQSVILAYRLLRATHAKLKKLQQKTENLTTKIEDISIINRAKLLLVEKLRMSESEAHRYIEKQAMDTCRKRRAVAEQIIRTYEE